LVDFFFAAPVVGAVFTAFDLAIGAVAHPVVDEEATFFVAVFFCLLLTFHAAWQACTRTAKASSSSNHPRLFS
jgi:hypothetical protein